jgi:hypothetical protein
MKKSLFMMAILAIAALTGCQDQTQSQLEFGDVADKATVQGYVYIDKGYVQEGSTYVVKSLPAAGCEVLVKVPYAKYDADAADGDKFFEGVCDANGFYSIEIPVGQAAITGVKVYTRPLVDKYYDLINGAIVETDASYPEASASVEIERGKVYTAANIYLAKDVQSPILTRSQAVVLKGSVKELYEAKKYIDPEDKDKGYYAIVGKRAASKKVNLVVTITNSEYSSEEIVYNITTDAEGNYNLSANLYDVWDVAKTKVEIKSKAYLAELTHYYQFWNEDDTEWVYKTQTVAGYFDSKKVSKTLASGDLLIGAKLADLVLAFTPDYASVKIYGIGNEDIDKVDSKTVYKSWNPLYWAY